MEAKLSVVNNWKHSEIETTLKELNTLSCGVIYAIEPKTKALKYHNFFSKLNLWIFIIELFYFTFLVPFDLLNFISTGTYKIHLGNRLTVTYFQASNCYLQALSPFISGTCKE